MFSFFRKKDHPQFKIHKEEQAWVLENLRWFTLHFGLPKHKRMVASATDDRLPNIFSAANQSIEVMISDLTAFLKIQSEVTFEIIKDVRDIPNVPYEAEGANIDTTLNKSEKGFHMTISNALRQRPIHLICEVILNLVHVKCVELGAMEVPKATDRAFVEFVGMLVGFGPVLSQGQMDIGYSADSQWSTDWQFPAQMAPHLRAYTLAVVTVLDEEDSLSWTQALSKLDQKLVEQAMDYFQNDDLLRNQIKEELAWVLFHLSDQQIQKHQWTESIALLREGLQLAIKDETKSTFYNNIGYYLTRLKHYEESLTYLEQASKYSPDFAYPYDNMGFALIQLGRADEGKLYLDRALTTSNNVAAYSLRNLALYFQSKGDGSLAEENFRKALNIGSPVDLLEFYYGEFLLQQQRREEAMTYFTLSSEKGEAEGKQALEKLSP